MILSNTINIKVNGKMVKKYKEMGYDVKQNDTIQLPIELLTKDSHQYVLCACDICGDEKEIKYQNYNKYLSTDPDGKYTCKKCNLEKRKKTCLDKYGVDFISKLEDSKIKAEQTMNKNGTNYYFCTEEYKKKMIEKYGVENPSYSEELKKKKEATCFKNFGVKNPSQSPLIHMKQHRGYILKHYNNLYYRGTYEKDFIDTCEKYEIKIENFSKQIKYFFNGRNRKYFPDFYYQNLNLIIEIKSTYTYEIEKEQNEAKKKAAIDNGFNFIFVIDKKYDDFLNRLNLS